MIQELNTEQAELDLNMYLSRFILKNQITINLEKRINVISHQGAMERAAARGAGGVAPGMELGVEDNNLYCCVQLLLLSIKGCNFRF